MQRGFQRRLQALFQSCGQTLEPLSELLDGFPCVIFLLCLPLRHLHNNHDRVRTDVTLPDSHSHAHAGEGVAMGLRGGDGWGGGGHTVCSKYTYTPWCQESIHDLTVAQNHTLHTGRAEMFAYELLSGMTGLSLNMLHAIPSMHRHYCMSAMTSIKQPLGSKLYFPTSFNQPPKSPRQDNHVFLVPPDLNT